MFDNYDNMFENYDNIFKNLRKEVVQTTKVVLEKVLKRWG